MIVDIEKYREWMAWKKSINATDIDDIEWRLNGNPISVPQSAYEDFRLLGMNNTDFPALYFGEEGIRVKRLLISRPAPDAAGGEVEKKP